MDKKYLVQYVEILDKLKKGQIITKTEENIKFYIERDIDLSRLVKDIRASDKQTALDLVEKFYNPQAVIKNEDELIKESLRKTYGVDLTDIEHLKLQNGLEVLAFYDNKLSRKRIIEYNDAKSLAREFSNIQNDNIMFQSDDYRKNANDIAQKEASKNIRRELNMVDINRVKAEYFDLIKRKENRDMAEVQCINELIKSAEKRRIKYINIENNVALDADNNIIEAFYDKKSNQVVIESPQKFQANTDTIDNTKNDASNPDTTPVDDTPIVESENEPTDFELDEDVKDAEFIAMANESAEIYHINCSRQQFYNNIVKYSKDMSKLEEDFAKNNITKEEYDCYSMCCAKYIAIKQKKMTKTKNLTLENRGFIGIIAVALLAIIFGIVVFIIYMMQ